MWTTLHFGGSSKTEKQAEEIYKGTPDIEFEQDWSVGSGATRILADGRKIKNYLSSFRDFSGKSSPSVATRSSFFMCECVSVCIVIT